MEAELKYNETDYRRWETKMTKIAKKNAKEYFIDFTDGNVRFIAYKTTFCMIDARYLLTKIQAILMGCDIIIDYSIEKGERAGQMDVSISLWSRGEFDESTSSDDESTSSDDDPSPPTSSSPQTAYQ